MDGAIPEYVRLDQVEVEIEAPRSFSLTYLRIYRSPSSATLEEASSLGASVPGGQVAEFFFVLKKKKEITCSSTIYRIYRSLSVERYEIFPTQ